MMMINIKRILRSGWEKFSRDQSSTGAALVVMTGVLSVISFLFVLQGMSVFLVEQLETGVDVSAYFKDTVTEEEIFQVRSQLLSLEEVEGAEYVSREEALRRFIESYRGQEEILASLDAVGRNPLYAHLNIRANDPSRYDNIAEFLSDEVFASVIANIDFNDREPVIERLSLVTGGIRGGVLLVSSILSVIAVLVAFNTIRLTIYNTRDEIEIMRLVGASSWFIRGPFLVQGALVGVAATALTLTFLFASGFLLNGPLFSFTGFDLIAFLTGQFFALLFLGLAVGIGLGVVSAMLAMRRHLQV